MTRISNLLIASTLSILPISAFAQQTAAPVKPAEPTGVTATAPSVPTTPATKTPAAKTETHAMTTTKTPRAKTSVPAKS